MKRKRKLTTIEGSLIWRKSFSLQTSISSRGCLSILQRMDDKTLKYFNVKVESEDQQDGVVKFHIESRNRYAKGWLFGTMEQEDDVVISGVAGVDPQMVFILLIMALIFPVVYFSLSSSTLLSIIILLGITLLAMSAISSGSIFIRNTLISELQIRLQSGESVKTQVR